MKKKDRPSGYVFTKHIPEEQTPFEKLFEIFQELIIHTSGDFDEAIDWLRQLDEEYQITTPDYSIEDFIDDLKKKGYIREEFVSKGNGDGQGSGAGGMRLTEKLEQALRKRFSSRYSGRSGEAEVEITRQNIQGRAMNRPANTGIISLATHWTVFL